MTVDEREARLEELRGQKSALEGLFKDFGWRLIEEALKAQVRARRISDFSQGISSIDDAFKSANAKSEIAGMQLALRMPEILLDDVKRDLEVLLAEEREETHG